MGNVNDHIAAALGGTGTINDKLIAFFAGITGGSTGQVLTRQSDGTIALQDVSGSSTAKTAARAVAVANVTVSNPGTATFDGVVLVAGDRLLLTAQTAGAENGIYQFNGSASALTRTTDADTSVKVTPGMTVFVSEGTLYSDTTWKLTTNSPITLGTTALTFSAVLLMPQGAAATPGLAFANDLNTGAFWQASDDLALVAGGIAGFRIQPTQVIIGVTLNPNPDTTRDLGSTALRWRNAYLKPVAGAGMKVGGLLSALTTTTGNVGTGEDDLLSYSVPAALLAANGDSIFFQAAGTIANNVNAKRIRVKFGATTILDSGAAGIPVSTAIEWTLQGRIIRTGAATQKCHATLNTSSISFTGFSSYETAAETLSGAVVLKLTGEATSDNDIVQEAMTVEFSPAP